MRKLIPALILTVTVLALGAPAASANPTAPAPASCISLPDLKLPSLCDLKAGTLDLAAKLGVQIGITINASLSFALNLAGGIVASLPGVLTLLLSLPTWVLRLLCL
jgi:hypothetical protein